jgi:predicted hotdog family 3-hydroxylacyl-ACP dehydratase
MRLDRTWIEQNIPHHGRMCLLDEVIEWDAEHIRCRSGTHRLPDHPLRSQGRLGIACGIEYAAQAMAAHGALAGVTFAGAAAAAGALGGVSLVDSARKENARPSAGLLAGLRDLRLQVLRLDDIETDLFCDAALVAGDRGTALYEFALRSETRRLLSGRATVVFDASVLSHK